MFSFCLDYIISYELGSDSVNKADYSALSSFVDPEAKNDILKLQACVTALTSRLLELENSLDPGKKRKQRIE